MPHVAILAETFLDIITSTAIPRTGSVHDKQNAIRLTAAHFKSRHDHGYPISNSEEILVVHRYPRRHFTAVLLRVCSRLDNRDAAEIEWSTRFPFDQRQCQLVRVQRIWAFGSYARGAMDCGDLDLIVEVKAEQEPPPSAVYRIFFGSTPDVRIYLGTPKVNGSGLEVPQAILIWDGPGHDWRASIDRIVEDPDATRFNRPLDNLPFRAEQLSVAPDVLEEIAEAEKRGIVKWAMSPLPTPLDADQLGRSGERFMRRVNLAGKKTQRVGAHVLAFMRPREHWFGSAPAWDGNNITWGGCEILMGHPYVPLHWLDRLGVFELVIAPHISRRGPNGIWSIARGENHPLVERLRGVEFFIFGWSGDVPPQHLIYVTHSDSFDSSYSYCVKKQQFLACFIL